MQLSTNYGLKLPEGTDNVKRQDFIDNFSKIDSVMKEHDTHLSDMVYQTAGGSATVITITIKGSLVNGYPITFIASSNNGGAATTINGKKLYKPGTTTSPNLTAGKAYTVWYNSAGDNGNGCFFIKASAEGDAIAANVLAGKKFSNDNDTGLVGTLDLSSLVSGNIKSGITINGVSGNASVVDTADATVLASQMISGTTAYKSGTKITGTMPFVTGDANAHYPANQLSAGAYSGDGVNYAYMGVPNGNYLNNIAWIKSAQPDLLAQNIVTGKSIFGLNGNATRSTYTTGVCTKNVAVELGFRPKLVIVDGNLLQVYSEYDSSLNMGFYKYTGSGSGSSNNFISISDTGFTSTGAGGKFICC